MVNVMSTKVFIQAIFKITLGFILMVLLIFLPAGSIYFFNGWILMAVLFIPMFFEGIIMMFKNPELLKRRLNSNESQKKQRNIVFLCAIMFVAGFIIAGLDFRFAWSDLPKSILSLAVLIFLAGYAIYGEVIRENIYLSRTIEIQENQRLIVSGLYGIIRHPMYFSTLFLFLSMPLILGSMYSFFVFLQYPFIIAKRIKYEEEFLEKELEGYKEYQKKVKYRLIPFIW